MGCVREPCDDAYASIRSVVWSASSGGLTAQTLGILQNYDVSSWQVNGEEFAIILRRRRAGIY